jgi:hypothetical protein
MASISIAFIVYKPVTLSLTIPAPLDWWELRMNQVSKKCTPLRDKANQWLSTAGQHSRGLGPGVYGLIAVGFGTTKPALEFSFGSVPSDAATFLSKEDKDPWPVPPPPPPPPFAAAAPEYWNTVTWRSTPLENPPTMTEDEKQMFLAVAGAGGTPPVTYHVFI